MNKDATTYLTSVKPKLKGVTKQLIETLCSLEPFEVKKAWDGLGFKRGSNYSCVIAEYKDHIKLMVMRGTMLQDPKDKFEGAGKNTRHIKYYKPEDIDKANLAIILSQQFDLYDQGVKWEG